MKKRLLLAAVIMIAAFGLVHAETRIVDSVSPGNPLVLWLDSLAGVTRIQVSVGAPFYNADITIEEKQAPEQKPDYLVYSYFGIASEKINASSVDISFAVSPDFIKGRGIDKKDIVLLKHDTSWKEVATSYRGYFNQSHSYNATADGFYLFAIAAKAVDNITLIRVPDSIEPGKGILLELLIANQGFEAKEYAVWLKGVNWGSWQVEGSSINREGAVAVRPRKQTKLGISIRAFSNTTGDSKNFYVLVAEGGKTKVIPVSLTVKGSPSLSEGASVDFQRMFEQIQGSNNRIKIDISNQDSISKRFVIRAELEDWADYEVLPGNVVFVDAFGAETAFVNIIPKTYKEMEKTFLVTVESDSGIVGEYPVSAVVMPSEVSEKDLNLAHLNAGILIFFFLIITFIIIGRLKK